MLISIQLSVADADYLAGKAEAVGLSLERYVETRLEADTRRARGDDAQLTARRRCARCRTLHLGIGEELATPQGSCQKCGKRLGKPDREWRTGSRDELIEVIAAGLSPLRANC